MKAKEYLKDKLGGDTFWVEHPDWEGQETALCFRAIKKPGDKGLPLDSKCSQVAGNRTSHRGEGACHAHGGTRLDNVIIKNGSGAVVTRSGLKRKIDEYIETGDRTQMLDLTYELASLRVLFQEIIEVMPDSDDKSYPHQVNRAVTMIQATGSLVDKISKIQSRNNITAAQVMYLRVVMADILAKHIPDPDARERAVKDLMSRVRGGEGDQETRIVAI